MGQRRARRAEGRSPRRLRAAARTRCRRRRTARRPRARRTAEARAQGPPKPEPRPRPRRRSARRPPPRRRRAQDGEQGSRKVSRALAVYAGSFDPGDARPPRPHRARRGALRQRHRRDRRPSDEAPALQRRRAQRASSRRSRRTSRTSWSTRFDGLLIDYCASKGASVIVRGLRVTTDFEYELQIAHANADLRPQIDTDLPADAHEARLRQRLAGPRDREPRRRRQPLRAGGRLRGAREEVREEAALSRALHALRPERPPRSPSGSA